ncbi:CLUMA_CG020034, isoform A [Clunio marinus]|uniref:CLUMA_CG020034, isoform A n=1 Tax=Clunio marinus TaxID=568069 RepID=A0A1J1J3M3_9DIPT|nr:CLUMA_CG020034, isoform A [Clunio marinus]
MSNEEENLRVDVMQISISIMLSIPFPSTSCCATDGNDKNKISESIDDTINKWNYETRKTSTQRTHGLEGCLGIA